MRQVTVFDRPEHGSGVFVRNAGTNIPCTVKESREVSFKKNAHSKELSLLNFVLIFCIVAYMLLSELYTY